jgi:dCMP deaminase
VSYPTFWDLRMMALAEHVASWSRDPSTKTGCALVRPDRSIASVGYNGFARGVADLPERLADRPTRLAYTVHAEPNAIFAARASVAGCSAYVWPWFPCASCAGALIQAGIVLVRSPAPTPEQAERWGESWAVAESMLSEAGVGWALVPRPVPSVPDCRVEDR